MSLLGGQDCVDHRVTVVHYIGELCRYLLNQPPGPHDRTHQVAKAFGNGLRADVWAQFQVGPSVGPEVPPSLLPH